MASIGATEVAAPKDGNRFTGSIKIQGRLHHKVGNLTTPDGVNPSYFQVYLLDMDEAKQVRSNILRDRDLLDEGVLETLTNMVHEHNPYVSSVKTAVEFIREKAAENDEVPKRTSASAS